MCATGMLSIEEYFIVCSVVPWHARKSTDTPSGNCSLSTAAGEARGPEPRRGRCQPAAGLQLRNWAGLALPRTDWPWAGGCTSLLHSSDKCFLSNGLVSGPGLRTGRTQRTRAQQHSLLSGYILVAVSEDGCRVMGSVGSNGGGDASSSTPASGEKVNQKGGGGARTRGGCSFK